MSAPAPGRGRRPRTFRRWPRPTPVTIAFCVFLACAVAVLLVADALLPPGWWIGKSNGWVGLVLIAAEVAFVQVAWVLGRRAARRRSAAKRPTVEGDDRPVLARADPGAIGPVGTWALGALAAALGLTAVLAIAHVAGFAWRHAGWLGPPALVACGLLAAWATRRVLRWARLAPGGARASWTAVAADLLGRAGVVASAIAAAAWLAEAWWRGTSGAVALAGLAAVSASAAVAWRALPSPPESALPARGVREDHRPRRS